MLELKPLDDSILGFHLIDSTVMRPLASTDDVLIISNDTYVPVDFLVLDIECNASCPIVFGKTFSLHRWCCD